MPLLSVAIITLNEEANLARTLASVSWADEIIVVDSGSTDRTLEIARSFNATRHRALWPGFAAQKNSAIAKCTCDLGPLARRRRGTLSPKLQATDSNLLPTNPPADAYYLKRRNLFLGRWIKHGGFYPDPKLRLFRRTAANLRRRRSLKNRPVHETIAFDGNAATLDYDLIHHAYPTLDTYIEHMDRYSSLGCRTAGLKGRQGQPLWPASSATCIRPATRTFMWNYFFRLGFLDGREGLLLHLYHATYTSWKYAKAWERARKTR